MKKLVTFLLLIGCVYGAKADHITGGEMFYTFAGAVNGQYQYNVTLKLFMRCNSGRQFNNPTFVSVFDKASNSRVMDISVPLSSQENANFTSTNPCITNPPTVCYDVGYYYFTVTVPASSSGYIIAGQVNYRIQGISNLSSGYGQVGATYTADIPGNPAMQNNSAHFTGSDLVLVCADNSFSYSFGAQDADGDELRYSFCDAYQSGGGGGTPGNATPATSPPYYPLPYGTPNFTGGSPLGGKVRIDPTTGLVTGVAPSEGKYVVTVCVEEVRAGIVIATQRKDLQINITSCTIAAASLLPAYMLCRNTQTITITNLSTSPLINTYEWKFKNALGATLFTSTAVSPTYTFADTGVYTIHLIINNGQQCSDSAATVVRVYPGFLPAFDYTGICISKPTKFTDATTTVYGQVMSWKWDFGDPLTTTDFSVAQHPAYTYLGPGIQNAQLIVTNSNGCIDTLVKAVPVVDKPPLLLAFKDTLICVPDKVQLKAGGGGNYVWSPLVNITNANTAAPTVAPLVTTTYYADLDDNGCKNRDSVKVRVVSQVTLQAMQDTIICRTDPIQLRVVSDGLRYAWTSNAAVSQIIDAVAPNPTVITNNASTQYEVTAFIGSCFARDQVVVQAIPYPVANAGRDTLICYKTPAQLVGTIDGSSLIWSPAATLSNAGIINPVASPVSTTAYVLLTYDTKGCPKPGRDTVLVTVLPDINAYAGNDTVVVAGQPLQLRASGGIGYLWTPATNLSNPAIAAPVAVYRNASAGTLYKILVFNEAGCVDSAFITVKVYATAPSVFVPNAFTPNGDGHNDVLRPIPAGIKRIEFFAVYNRLGQMVFQSGDTGAFGWNGTVGGKQQAAGAYVWVVKAVDYTGAAWLQRGTVVLIR
jgi:gliding motility-associated-like protein